MKMIALADLLLVKDDYGRQERAGVEWDRAH